MVGLEPERENLARELNGVNPLHFSLQNDFMALFDSATKPKIKQPASSASSTSRSKKLSSNAVKVLWQESVRFYMSLIS